jgi:hypothetical protein
MLINKIDDFFITIYPNERCALNPKLKVKMWSASRLIFSTPKETFDLS